MLEMLDKIEGIIFDSDGTLVRTDMNLPKDLARRIIQMTGDGVYNEEKIPYFWFGGNGITRSEILSREFKIKNVKEFWKIWNPYMSNFDYTMKFKSLYEDVSFNVKFLNLKEIPLAIVTDPASNYAIPQLEKLNIKEYFNPIITLSDTKGVNEKPDPRGLILCAEQMGIPKEKTVYIGDSTNDLYAAERAGMDFIWMNRGEHRIYTNPKKEIKSLYELK
jgi:HAD superfamily hydrolase (TIGR01549 family)